MDKCAQCSLDPVNHCLQTVPIFSGLGPQEMGEILSITTEKKYQKGESIYLAGKVEKRLYVIHSGRVKISRLSPTGKSQLIRVLGPGEFTGELTILNDTPLSDYAEAMENVTLCMIQGRSLKEIMKKYPSIALKIMEELSFRLEKAEALIEDINLHSAERRLAAEIISQSGDKDEFTLSLTKGDLASQIGMTQETLSRKLALFQDLGLLQLRGQRSIIILDREGLKAQGATI